MITKAESDGYHSDTLSEIDPIEVRDALGSISELSDTKHLELV